MMSKVIAAVLATGTLLASLADANAANSESAAVQQTVRAFNAGANSPADCSSDAAIIDEFAPFGWNSLQAWGDALEKYNTQNGVTDSKLSRPKFKHVYVDGTHAYAVALVVYSYKQNGRTYAEHGSEVLGLERNPSGWCVKSFAWLNKAGVDNGTEAAAIIMAAKDFASLKNGPPTDPWAITDEVPPYAWQGAKANTDWFGDFQKAMGAEHDADLKVRLSDPSHLSVNGDRAYAVFPAVLDYTHDGKPASEHGSYAGSYEKQSGRWRLTSWAWAAR